MTSPKPANTVFAVRVKGRPPGRERFNEIAEAEQAAEALAISSGFMVEIVGTRQREGSSSNVILQPPEPWTLEAQAVLTNRS